MMSNASLLALLQPPSQKSVLLPLYRRDKSFFPKALLAPSPEMKKTPIIPRGESKQPMTFGYEMLEDDVMWFGLNVKYQKNCFLGRLDQSK